MEETIFFKQTSLIAELCADVSREVLKFYGDFDRLRITSKSNETPLTEADMAAHRMLCSKLGKIIDLPILSEESPNSSYTFSQDYWLIDPIDGTREFINRTGDFCILVARIKNRRPVLSVIFEPLTGIYWFAGTNLGSYKKKPDQNAYRIFCRSRNGVPTVITAHKKISRRHHYYFTSVFGDYIHSYKGSALKFCVIAEGGADIYPKLSAATCQWDTAAGDLLLQEAGGGMTYYPNDIYLYGLNIFTVNPPFLAYGKVSANELARYISFMRRQIEAEGRFAPYFLPSK